MWGVFSIGPQAHLNHHWEPEVCPSPPMTFIQHKELTLILIQSVFSTLDSLDTYLSLPHNSRPTRNAVWQLAVIARHPEFTWGVLIPFMAVLLYLPWGSINSAQDILSPLRMHQSLHWAFLVAKVKAFPILLMVPDTWETPSILCVLNGPPGLSHESWAHLDLLCAPRQHEPCLVFGALPPTQEYTSGTKSWSQTRSNPWEFLRTQDPTPSVVQYYSLNSCHKWDSKQGSLWND